MSVLPVGNGTVLRFLTASVSEWTFLTYDART
jgi:hypothetical protein